MMPLVLLILSIIGLAIASRISVDSGVKIADFFGAKESAVGFILIAVFTSLPELFVGIFSGLSGHPEISLGNVIGSNIADILLVLGAGILLAGGVRIRKESLVEQVDVLFLVTIIPIILMARRTVSRLDGLLLIVLFAIYLIIVAKEGRSKSRKENYSTNQWLWINIEFWGGLVIVIMSSYYAVSASVELAKVLGIPDWVISLSIIALGTSLPELAVDITAIKRGHTGLAIGDILGSCVTNITLVLGTTLIISPIHMDMHPFIFPISVLMLVNAWLWYMAMSHKKISKTMGLGMILAYVVFIMLEFLL